MKHLKTDMFIFLLIFAFLSMPIHLFSADKKVYEIRRQSQIMFVGRSNINTFSFRSENISGKGCINTDAVRIDSVNKHISNAVDGFFRVDVKTFDSGNSRMNQDMYDALKAEQHSYIQFKLESIETEHYNGQTGAQLSAWGFLQVAGVENLISLTVTVMQQDEHLYRLQGSKQIHMTDYDIEPPQALLGLVQTRDKLTVEFDIYAGAKFQSIFASSL